MGSKRRLVDQIVERLPTMTGGRYFEPFLGSGAVYFSYRPRSAVLGDTNVDLMNAWTHIRAAPDALWASVDRIPYDRATYYEVREAFKTETAEFARATQFVYLNRFCFNGVYRTNRQNHFNVPYGSRTGSLPSMEAFRTCAKSLGPAVLQTADFEETLRGAGDGDIVYLDPPWPTTRPNHGEYGYEIPNAQRGLSRLLPVIDDVAQRGATVFLSLPSSVATNVQLHLSGEYTLTYSVASRSTQRIETSEVLLVAGANVGGVLSV